MRRPRLIRVYKSLGSGGGVQSRLMELLPRLAEHFEVRVLCYRQRGDRADELESKGIPVDFIPLGVKWAPWNVRRYVDYFRTHAPDIVHTHEYTANTLGITAATRAGVPVRVRHLHTLVPWGWEGKWRTKLRVLADRRAASRSQLTLAVSEAVRRHFLQQMRLPAESCRVLYNGIDLARFRGSRDRGSALRAEFGIDAGAPVVGIVGRLSRGKGHREFLLASAIIAQQEPTARFLVVGEGGLRPELESLCDGLNLRDRVLFMGHRVDVPAMLGAMNVFLLSSLPDQRGRIQDGLPGVAIEAQAAGLPMVAFRLPMMDEVLEEGLSGTLVPVGDVEGAAAGCLRFLRGDRDLIESASIAATNHAKRFSLDKCLQNTLGIYDELLSKQRAR